ncbi:MAG: hypothetical protein GXO92_00030 [FCB group bacterium]|nr:hypothetical protein [FCB group bacterium]
MSQTQEEVKTPKFCFLIPVQPTKDGVTDLSPVTANAEPFPNVSTRTPAERDTVNKNAKTSDFPVNLTFVS